MAKNRIVVICLDAYDPALSDRLIAQGRLTGMARLKSESARFELEHGPGGKARHTGLSWEHFVSGRGPETAEKWSAISFDPKTFRARQSFATERPFLADTAAKCVVFDAPYFDLRALPNGMGMVAWGGHDPGVAPYCRPAGLRAEVDAKFGEQPDQHALSVMTYPSAEQTAQMAADICAATRKRGDVIEWLLAERAPDWEVAVVGFSEPHDSIELFYYGLDPNHHLAHLPSAKAAGEGLIAVYEAVSAQLERLMGRFPDAAFVTFTMHGMGDNDTDLPTMLLLPELLFRMNFRRPLFRSREDWRAAEVSPVLRPGESWSDVIGQAMRRSWAENLRILPSRAAGKARRMASAAAAAMSGRRAPAPPPYAEGTFDVDWMPAASYARYWPRMDAFALPAYFDGRVRVNLAGREQNGRVPLSRYAATLDDIEAVLRACVDIKTGAPVVSEISRPGQADPLALDDTQADLCVLWNGSPIGFRHPVLGDIGPAPLRRPGGHSGGRGALYLRGAGLAPGDYGVRSSFDVAPTVVELMGAIRPNRFDGESVLGAGGARTAA